MEPPPPFDWVTFFKDYGDALSLPAAILAAFFGALVATGRAHKFAVQRADRQRDGEAVSLACALHGEIYNLMELTADFVTVIESGGDLESDLSLIEESGRNLIYFANQDKIGLLRPDLVTKILRIYRLLMIDRHGIEKSFSAGGRRSIDEIIEGFRKSPEGIRLAESLKTTVNVGNEVLSEIAEFANEKKSGSIVFEPVTFYAPKSSNDASE